MLENESFMERIKAGLPALAGIALVIACVLGIVMIFCLIKLANVSS